jgi:uncharacterized protein YndB with AHSA1/START domain
MTSADTFNPQLDLRFTRVVDVPKALIWRAWTEPALLMPWFCPLPWKTIDCEIDLRPGGMFRTTLQSPEGQAFPNLGCFLAVQAEEKLVWTNALLPGFRPCLPVSSEAPDAMSFQFTAQIELADHPGGTQYTATVFHADEAGCQQHAAMGFEAGWGTALDQMLVFLKNL